MNTTLDPLRRRTLLATCAFAALLNLACTATARADNLVRMDVIDRDVGDTLRVWRDHGRPVVAGRPGSRYAVRLVNNSGERVLAVLAIDGVNVVSGETASVNQRGYVLGPYQHTEIIGWRKSDRDVAAFEFTALADSYAARTGRPLDVGVIGVAVFREAPRLDVSNDMPASPPQPAPRQLPAPRLDFGAMSKAAPSPATAAPADTNSAAASAEPEARRSRDALGELSAGRAQPDRLGTGHGSREPSASTVTTFQRASSQPAQRIEIRYDSQDNLVAAGIIPPPRYANTAPHSFPADPPRDYVPDPPAR
ncbi:MAG: hypothetical protein ABIR54_01880 [Burkholderiaceae bacterium]